MKQNDGHVRCGLVAVVGRSGVVLVKVVLASAVLAFAVSGCVGARSSGESTLRARDFAATGAESELPEEGVSSGTKAADGAGSGLGRGPGPSARTGPVAASGGMFDVVGVAGEPTLSALEPAATTAPVLVDGVVGYINNRAIYISDFLAPMEAILKAEVRKQPREKWIEFSRGTIARALNDLISDELLRAEALSSLTIEQRQGFFSYLQRLQNDFISKNYGSRETAERRLRDSDGSSDGDGLSRSDRTIGPSVGTVEEWTKAKEQQELVRLQLSRQILDRMNVSWRDIQLGYEQKYTEFNPAPVALFRLISAKRNSDAAGAIGRALESGKDFTEVALSKDNLNNPKEGGLVRRPFEKAYELTEFFAVAILNEKAHGLKPGEWAGPMEEGSSVYWLKLDGVERRSMDLYDAQWSIERQIEGKRTQEATIRYIERLKQRASFTNIDEMTERLVRISIERYLPPVKATAGLGK